MATEVQDKLLVDLHVSYIQGLDTVSSSRSSLSLRAHLGSSRHAQKRQDLAYYFTEHLRMNGIYWGLTTLALMGRQDALPKQEMLDWVMSCWREDVGEVSIRCCFVPARPLVRAFG